MTNFEKLLNFIPDGWPMPLGWSQLVEQIKEGCPMKYTTNSIQLNDALYFLLRYLMLKLDHEYPLSHVKLHDDIEAYLSKNYKVEEE